MRLTDNCIEFGPLLAELYDRTRPFKTNDGRSKALRHCCDALITHFQGKRQLIRLLDVGAGTGRVALRLAVEYETLAEQRPGSPKLSIVCMDRSQEMLNKLIEKMKSMEPSGHVFRHVAFEPIQGDIRDIHQRQEVFDAAFAHWIFHVVMDWQVGAFALDKVLASDALLFLAQETSPLYSVIDGDLHEIKEGTRPYDLWRSYHDQIRHFQSRVQSESPFSRPRTRIGTYVIDGRVPQLLAALGWEEPQKLPEWDELHYDFSFSELIEDIVKKRAFTNMRLGQDEQLLSTEYAHIANALLREFRKELSSCWRFRGSFSVAYTKRRSAPLTASNKLLIDVARDIVGRRWIQRAHRTLDDRSLLRRLLDVSWERINRGRDQETPLGGTEIQGTADIDGLWLRTVIDGRPVAKCVHRGARTFWDGAEEHWRALTEHIETSDPFVLWFSPNDSTTQTRTVETSWHGSSIYPCLHALVISPAVRQALASTRSPTEAMNGKSQDSPRDRVVALSRGNAPVAAFLRNAIACGVLPYGDVGAHTDFLLCLSLLAEIQDVAGLYVLPIPVGGNAGDQIPSGCMLTVRNPLHSEVKEFIWPLLEVLCGAGFPGASHKYGTIKEIRPVPRHPSPIKKAALAAQHATILVVTAVDVEHDAVLEQTGVANVLAARRLSRGTHAFVDLGFGDVPVWWAPGGKGSTGATAASVTISEAIRVAKPWAVIMVGIAYGLKEDKQCIGDILLSNKVFSYEPQRVGTGDPQSRGESPSASPLLLEWFAVYGRDWQQGTPERTKPTIWPGLVISGDKLVDNPGLRGELIARSPDAIGGEMEGAGLISAIGARPRHWILVKAICDWGMGKGDAYQQLAARNAASYVFHVLGQFDVLRMLRKRDELP